MIKFSCKIPDGDAVKITVAKKTEFVFLLVGVLMSLLVGLGIWLIVCVAVIASLFHYFRVLGMTWRYFQNVIFWALVDKGSTCSVAWGEVC